MKIRLPKKRRYRILLYLFSVGLILLAADLVLVRVWRTIHVGHDTTRITGPLRPDGTVDYVAALNEKASVGVTADNNAAPLLLEAIGDNNPTQEKIRPQIYQKLGLPLPPASVSVIKYQSVLDEYLATLKLSNEERAIRKNDLQDEQNDLGKKFWQASDHPVAALWIQRNEKTLALLAQAVERPRCYLPCITDESNVQTMPAMISVLLPTLGGQRELANVATARAMLRAGSGDIAGARADLAMVHRLARFCGQQHTLIEALVAIAMEQKAFNAEQDLALSGKLSPVEARAMAKEIAALTPVMSVYRCIDTGERFMFLDAVTYASRFGFSRMYHAMEGISSSPSDNTRSFSGCLLDNLVPIHYDAILRQANLYYDQLVAVSTLPTYRQRREAFQQLEAQLIARKGFTINPTNLMMVILMPSFNRVGQLQDQYVMSQSLTAMALALSAYKSEKGVYPSQLSALVPDYLASIPQDRFNDEPLHYKITPSGYLLYSVGPNMNDEDGQNPRTRKTDSKGDDITITTEPMPQPATQIAPTTQIDSMPFNP